MSVTYASDADAGHAARFFAERPAGAKLWNHLVDHARTWGPIEATATKSRVCLKARTRFLWCPQANLDGHIYIRFWYPTPLFSDSSWQRVDAAADGRMSHRVKIKDLDEDVLAWFEAAYRFDTA